MMVAAAGIVVAIAMLVYHYRSASPTDESQRPAAKDEASGRGASPNTGVIGRTPPAESPKAPARPPKVAVEPPKAPAQPPKVAVEPPKPPLESPKAPVAAKAPAAPLKAEKSTVITRLPEAPPATPLDAPPRAAAAPLRQGRASAEPLDTKAAASPPTPQAAGKAPERAPSRPQVCTEATAALGLCVFKPAQKGKAGAPVQAAATREQAIDAGRAAGQEPAAPSQTCTEAVAALGLCPKPTPRKE